MLKFSSETQTDKATGVFNSRGLSENIGMLWDSARSKKQTMLFISVECHMLKDDGNYSDNQACTHNLQQFTSILQAHCEHEDEILARVASESFVMVLNDYDISSSVRKANLIKRDILNHQIHKGLTGLSNRFSAAIGYYIAKPSRGGAPNEAIEFANTKMQANRMAGQRSIAQSEINRRYVQRL